MQMSPFDAMLQDQIRSFALSQGFGVKMRVRVKVRVRVRVRVMM
jgi:hypothetical protein